MKKKVQYGQVDFYREVVNDNVLWYADVHQHSKGQNLMVSGADILLSQMYNTETKYFGKPSNLNRLLVKFSTTADKPFIFHLKQVKHNLFGADYVVYAGAVCINWIKPENIFPEGATIWLCNVVHTLFGTHPKDIYITDIKVHPDDNSLEWNVKEQ